jgi:streptomycin 6-kinase
MVVDVSGCAAKIIDIHGTTGVAWLERLPDTLAEVAERWSLTVLPPFGELSYNYVAPAVCSDGTHVVLKAGVPSPGLRREAEALRRFNGNGIARCLAADLDHGVLCLERLIPGTPLTRVLDDEQVTHITVRVMRELWKPAPPEQTFATVAEWAGDLNDLREHFDSGYGPFPGSLVDTAQGLFGELIGSASVLIHGDMHPGNILRGGRESWLAIDPKGVVGDPFYDVATFATSLPDGLDRSQLKRFLSRRVDQLAKELKIERECILAWGLAQSVLSGWWSYEDHGQGWEWAFARAELFDELRHEGSGRPLGPRRS